MGARSGNDGGLMGRRTFSKLALAAAGNVALASFFPLTAGASEPSEPEQPAPPLSHQQFLETIGKLSGSTGRQEFLTSFKQLMLETAWSCVLDAGDWVIPSKLFEFYFFSRDSFWVLAALENPTISDKAVARFAADQLLNPDGHIATALRRDGSRPPLRDRAEESTMMFVLHNYQLSKLGGAPNLESLERAYDFILTHIKDGSYVTTGETRRISVPGGVNEIGAYHYWADTFRPAGKPAATSEVIAYNQGLLCVTLKCLEEMNVAIDPQLRPRAEEIYRGMVNPEDGVSLPQRMGSTIIDVASLVGEALSLYLFDRPILSTERVEATFNRFSKVHYPDGSFLGYKVISDYYGGYRHDNEFIIPQVNRPGNYHHGASWLLYDALALYVAGRHNLPGATDLFFQRLQSEVRYSWASHEFISTSPDSLGSSDTLREAYGWNTFVLNLLP